MDYDCPIPVQPPPPLCPYIMGCEQLEVILNGVAARPGPCVLKVLSLAGNECRSIGGASVSGDGKLADALTKALLAHAGTLTHLDVGALPRVAMHAALECAPRLANLQTLDLSGSQLNLTSTRSTAAANAPDTIGRALSTALADPTCRLKRLILVHCSLVAHDLREIGGGVLKCKTLVAVDLSYNNNIGDEGCRELARWIRAGSEGGTGAKRIRGKMKAGGGGLARLELECCGIGDAGAKCLAVAVAANLNLMRLDLALNINIGKSGRAALASASSGRSGIWHQLTTEDTPWAGSGSDNDDDDEDRDEEDNSYLTDDDGYFASHRVSRPSPWSLD